MRLGDTQLEAYSDESLPVAEMAEVERRLRADPILCQRLAAIQARRDSGIHGLAAIWRRHRLSCLSRDQWGSYLLGALSAAEADYARFHLEVVGCRYCAANVADLKQRQQEPAAAQEARQRRYFQSSAGRLRPGR